MRWSERQVAMLHEMGVRWWQPADDGPATSDPSEEAAAPAPVRHASASPAPDGRPSVDRPAPSAPAPAVAQAWAGTAALGWEELRDAVAACTACGLCRGRRQTVFGVGHRRAEWMIVGEAPGEQEDIQGEPFVGRSGQLLDNMLRAIGLTRSDDDAVRQVYIANTIKCRPPGNRNPEPDELARCEPFLIRQIQLVQPRIIVAMGRFAVQSLLRSSDPIGRLRGRVHQYQNVPLIVTYHPAYLLRNPEEKAKAWDDLCLALATLRATAPA